MSDDMLEKSADICVQLSELINLPTNGETKEEVLVYVLADT